MEFETLFKVIVAIAATVAIPVAAYAAVAATRTIWGRPADAEYWGSDKAVPRTLRL